MPLAIDKLVIISYFWRKTYKNKKTTWDVTYGVWYNIGHVRSWNVTETKNYLLQ